MKEWVLYSTMALLVWGLWAFLPKLAISCLEPKTAFMFEVIGGAVTGLAALPHPAARVSRGRNAWDNSRPSHGDAGLSRSALFHVRYPNVQAKRHHTHYGPVSRREPGAGNDFSQGKDNRCPVCRDNPRCGFRRAYFLRIGTQFFKAAGLSHVFREGPGRKR